MGQLLLLIERNEEGRKQADKAASKDCRRSQDEMHPLSGRCKKDLI